MGRTKPTPKKHTSDDSWRCRALNFVPVAKRRRSNRRKPLPEFVRFTLPSETSKELYLGFLVIGTTNNVLPETYEEGTITFNHSSEEEAEDEGGYTPDSVLLQFNDESLMIVKLQIDTHMLKEIFKAKVFTVDFQVDGSRDVYIKLYFKELPLLKFNNRIGNCIKEIFLLMFNKASDDAALNNSNKELYANSEILNIYKTIQSIRKEDSFKLEERDVQHARLKPTLRPYQEAAVRWMLHRESQQDSSEFLNPLFTEIVLETDVKIYYNKFTGYVTRGRPVVTETCNGGILADEMGLGKTVEVLACVLLHPKVSKKGNIIDSESEEDENPIIDTEEPTVEIPNKKKNKRNTPAETQEYVDKPKKLKVPNDWLKVSEKKSKNYVALQMFYASTLSKFCTTSSQAKDESPQVQCICGNLEHENTVTCVECEKIQHVDCLAYKRSLGPYRCPQCWIKMPLVDTKATLIVTPQALKQQWCKEICKHIKSGLKVLVYTGHNSTPVYPTALCNYDLVVTTYNVIQNELRLTATGNVPKFRNQRKYLPPGCPLVRMNWWRVCLDEAQTVEMPGTMVSTMAQKLEARYRWAITGTPISKEISDVYGLIDYLQIEPFNDADTWKYILYTPFVKGDIQPMCKFLSKVLWRTAKVDVLDQINIPAQTFQEHLLEFSAVEKFFYKCEHELSCDSFLKKLQGQDLSVRLSRMDKSALQKMLIPLLTLRQACSHPNTVRGRYLATKKNVTSIKDLLDALILKNTNDSEESLRLAISSLNGLAGIYLLQRRDVDAVDQYRKVLQLYARFTEDKNEETKLNVDKLQVIHSMFNLAEVLDRLPNHEPTLRDSELRGNTVELEQKYMEKFMNQSLNSYLETQELLATSTNIQESFVLNDGQWYSDGLNWIFVYGHFDELWSKIEAALDTANITISTSLRRASERELLMQITNWDEAITDFRVDLHEAINTLYDYNPDADYKILLKPQIVLEAMECHLRPQNKKKTATKKCPICVVNKQLIKYEEKLFRMRKRKTNEEDEGLVGNWGPTTEELILKSISNVLKAKNASEELVKDGSTHIRLIATLKREFKETRRFWTFLDQQVCAKDELDICKIRLQLKSPDAVDEPEPVNKHLKNLSYKLTNKLETVHMLSEHELYPQEYLLKREEAGYMLKLEKCLGTQRYLQTLRTNQHSVDPCPICQNPLEVQWSILQCGHSYCLVCIQLLLEQCMSNKIQCSVCRSKQYVHEISYIKVGQSVTEQDTTNIKGNYSTKIEAVVKLVLQLRTKEKSVKILLFSSWIQVLQCLKKALDENGIVNELASSGNVEKRVEIFKDASKEVTALLLPIHLGAKGLNLIEATHVVMVEPLLNPADELQAIGRIHRIGQTRATVVHKFLIKNTIEESVYQATTSNVENWDKNKVTLQQLRDLFVDNESEATSGEDETQQVVI